MSENGSEHGNERGNENGTGYEHNKQWICVTGIDGCGKTTAAQYLTARLAPKSKYWKSPHFDWVRDMMKLFGKDNYGKDVHSDALAFATAHRAEQYLLRKWWEHSDILVSQRGVVDYYTFLGVEGMSVDDCDKILRPNDFNIDEKPYAGKFVAPHTVVFMECDTARALKRIPKEDKYEVTEFLERLEPVYQRFFENPPPLFKDTKIYRVDATPDPRTVQRSLDAIASEIRGECHVR